MDSYSARFVFSSSDIFLLSKVKSLVESIVEVDEVLRCHEIAHAVRAELCCDYPMLDMRVIDGHYGAVEHSRPSCVHPRHVRSGSSADGAARGHYGVHDGAVPSWGQTHRHQPSRGEPNHCEMERQIWECF